MLELAKIPFPEVKRLADGGRALTILPVGVVEEHGAHLPLGLDSFAAEIYSASAAPLLEQAGYEVVIAPTINYGVARSAIDFPGTLSLEPETLRSMVVEIGRSLARHGLSRLVILNGHRDLHHMKALDDARPDIAGHLGLAYAKAGSRANAVAELKRALSSDNFLTSRESAEGSVRIDRRRSRRSEICSPLTATTSR